MIALVAASAIFLTATQALINAPRDAFRACLKETSNKAQAEKVQPDAWDAYVRNACSGQLSAFKSAVMKFDMGNKMSRKASDDDANSMIADFVGSAVENYRYLVRGNEPATQTASAPAAAATPPPPTPAAAPQPPK